MRTRSSDGSKVRGPVESPHAASRSMAAANVQSALVCDADRLGDVLERAAQFLAASSSPAPA